MRRIMAVILAIMCVISFAAAEGKQGEAAPEEERRLSYFWFTYGGYMPSVNYEVFMLQDEYYLCIGEGPSMKIDPSVAEALSGIIASRDLVSWDGFNENDPYVLDGEGFSMRLVFSDGTQAEASGENSFPDGYHNAKNEMIELLDKAAAGRRGDVTGIYRYEGEGAGGDFTITIARNGSYTFYEGPLSSYIGSGAWYMANSRMELYEDGEKGYWMHFTFIPVEDALVFTQDEYSDNFLYVQVPDGGRFIRDTSVPYGTEAELAFDSFDGGGPAYAPEIEDRDILTFRTDVEYRDENHAELDGAAYDVIFYFAGLAPGTTKVTVHAQSPAAGDEEYVYTATVDENLNVVMEEE